MHELAVTKGLIELLLEECNKLGKKQISNVVIEVGELTKYKKESLELFFDMLKKESKILENSKLEVHEIEGELLCGECNSKSLIDEPYMIFCPKCESMNVEILKGKEFNLKEIK